MLKRSNGSVAREFPPIIYIIDGGENMLESTEMIANNIIVNKQRIKIIFIDILY